MVSQHFLLTCRSFKSTDANAVYRVKTNRFFTNFSYLLSLKSARNGLRTREFPSLSFSVRSNEIRLLLAWNKHFPMPYRTLKSAVPNVIYRVKTNCGSQRPFHKLKTYFWRYRGSVSVVGEKVSRVRFSNKKHTGDLWSFLNIEVPQRILKVANLVFLGCLIGKFTYQSYTCMHKIKIYRHTEIYSVYYHLKDNW